MTPLKKKLLIIGLLSLTTTAVIAQAVVTSDGLIAQTWATLKTSSLTIGTGTPVVKCLTATGTPDFDSCGTNATVTANITVTGATTNDAVFFNLVSPHTSFRYNAFVSAADTVTISASNISITNSIDQDPISARVVVIGY